MRHDRRSDRVVLHWSRGGVEHVTTVVDECRNAISSSERICFVCCARQRRESEQDSGEFCFVCFSDDARRPKRGRVDVSLPGGTVLAPKGFLGEPEEELDRNAADRDSIAF